MAMWGTNPDDEEYWRAKAALGNPKLEAEFEQLYGLPASYSIGYYEHGGRRDPGDYQAPGRKFKTGRDGGDAAVARGNRLFSFANAPGGNPGPPSSPFQMGGGLPQPLGVIQAPIQPTYMYPGYGGPDRPELRDKIRGDVRKANEAAQKSAQQAASQARLAELQAQPLAKKSSSWGAPDSGDSRRGRALGAQSGDGQGIPSEVSGFFAAAQQSQDATRAANESRYNEILAGYRQRETDAQAGLDKFGTMQRRAIDDQYAKQSANTEQDMISRGLGNTTLRTSALNDLGEVRGRLYGDLDERLARQRLELMSGLSGDRLGFMERRNDVGTDPALIANIAGSMGEAGIPAGLGGMPVAGQPPVAPHSPAPPQMPQSRLLGPAGAPSPVVQPAAVQQPMQPQMPMQQPMQQPQMGSPSVYGGVQRPQNTLEPPPQTGPKFPMSRNRGGVSGGGAHAPQEVAPTMRNPLMPQAVQQQQPQSRLLQNQGMRPQRSPVTFPRR